MCALTSGKGQTGFMWFHISGGLACLLSHLMYISCCVQWRWRMTTAAGCRISTHQGVPRQAAASQGTSLGGFFSVASNMQGKNCVLQRLVLRISRDNWGWIFIEPMWQKMIQKQKAAWQVHWNLSIRKSSINKPAAAEPVADTKIKSKPINKICKSTQILENPNPHYPHIAYKRVEQLLACHWSKITFLLLCYPLSSHPSLVFTLSSCVKTLRSEWDSKGWELSLNNLNNNCPEKFE